MSQNRKGITHARANCPVCHRLSVAGGIDRETGHIVLRQHKTPAGAWCSSGRRLDVEHYVRTHPKGAS